MIITKEKSEINVSANDFSRNPPVKLKIEKELKSYLEVDFKLEDELFDFYVQNPKMLNKEIRNQIIRFFSTLGFGS